VRTPGSIGGEPVGGAALNMMLNGAGYLRVELKAAVREHKADLLVLGKPAGDDSVYALRELKNLAANIEAETEFG
jgi:hypothetical protein